MYKAPTEEIAHILRHVAGLNAAIDAGKAGDLDGDVLDAIVEEAGRFASERMAPALADGDHQGARLAKGDVTTPEGWPTIYREWREGGWNALTGPQAHGGQELPMALSTALFEIWNSASMGFAIGPSLTIGAVEALIQHGSDALRARYLDKLVSGEWMGTMNLTEPQAGSDLSGMKTRAEPAGDGTYRIFGSKIYITYGEQDFTDNIVHLVLARLPDAPAGVKGISLFLVPKFLVNEDGSLGARNDVVCSALEKKLGIHGSPTCTMIYGDGTGNTGERGAIGWLVGEENRGLACMFTMMNNARLLVGIQGVGVAEAATQKALDFARERRQGRSTRLAKGPEGKSQMSAIVDHPDVARMLLTMKALTGAARSICYACGHAGDMAKHHAGTGETDAARSWKDRVDLLTPIAKAFSTDIGVEVANLGIQVHGGMGFVEETGAARLLRDARIAPIYEGTNGIQAIDLVTRKIGLSGGGAVESYMLELRAVLEALEGRDAPDFGRSAAALDAALRELETATRYLQDALARGETDTALAGATAYLKLFGLCAGGIYLVKSALASDPDGARTALARFMAENLLAECAGLSTQVREGAESLAFGRIALGLEAA
ncbi:acyl-CoA dehydrogenase family protein [Fulvimarina sp. 2208YS6-2-32]|uniref:Acyl-CoA dehydrogenase family protein n=1 Tax=Fulvimarina uroteuthidis TaxID=3098149 RepID=A0ABU5HXT1_9HYPH|nr:acyl-CoA dehydrogenase family protein [Fulvimarina sp. 2208YS6-2-32]MDY8107605.1 acyl-CoA dehydrogenase family protein [Fulvimarina sp. 2208YS6-2-32]